ncbi:MAG: stage II sporulation protein R [Bacillota bacterium]
MVTSEAEYLRLHIRADSNSQEDQQTKYAVRDGVLSYVTEITATASSAVVASEMISEVASEISQLASEISGGEVTVEIATEQFPTREYNGEILPAGEYSAIIINLGSGEGDNWWCVAFPPLCYIDGEEVEGDEIILKSKVAEILDKYL